MSRSLLDLLDLVDAGLVRQAFTHSSLATDRSRSYERLEFLGDSVLSLSVTSELYRRFPQHSEGHLARLRAYVVSRATCARVAEELGLDKLLRKHATDGHDPAEIRQLAGSSNVLADLTEAVIGAVYLTFGFEAVHPAVVAAFHQHIVYAERSHVDNKTELQELLARTGQRVRYELVGETGPAHERRFQVQAVVGDDVLGHGDGPSKKRAEQMAAGEALELLQERSREDRPRRVRLMARRPRAGRSEDGQDASAPQDQQSQAALEDLHGQATGEGSGTQMAAVQDSEAEAAGEESGTQVATAAAPLQSGRAEDLDDQVQVEAPKVQSPAPVEVTGDGAEQVSAGVDAAADSAEGRARTSSRRRRRPRSRRPD